MAIYKTLTIDRLVMREDFSVSESSGDDGRTLDLSGRESMPRHSMLGVNQRREDFLGMANKFVPVVFTEKPNLSGFYQISDVSGDITNWHGSLAIFDWEASLIRVGSLAEVDIESRLYGPQSKANDFAVVGTRTHGPAIGHKAYWSGSAAPPTIERITTEGTLRVYTGLGLDVHPRWAITPANYNSGRVRFIDADGFERSGKQFDCPADGWELNNGMVRIKPLSASGMIEFAGYNEGQWWSKNWDILAGGNSLAPVDYCSMLYNTQEMVVIRLTKSLNPGRVAIDLTLKRGSRFVEIFVQHQFGTTLKVVRTTAEAGTAPAGAGYVAAGANDANGDKYVVGSTKTFTADTTNGGLSIAATATLDAMIGLAIDGDVWPGETPADLYAQYIGSPSESVQAVRR